MCRTFAIGTSAVSAGASSGTGGGSSLSRWRGVARNARRRGKSKSNLAGLGESARRRKQLCLFSVKALCN